MTGSGSRREASAPWRRALFGLLGAYLGAMVGFFVGLPLGYLAFLLALLFAVAGAIAVAAETRRIRRLAVGLGMLLPAAVGYLVVFVVS